MKTLFIDFDNYSAVGRFKKQQASICRNTKETNNLIQKHIKRKYDD